MEQKKRIILFRNHEFYTKPTVNAIATPDYQTRIEESNNDKVCDLLKMDQSDESEDNRSDKVSCINSDL